MRHVRRMCAHVTIGSNVHESGLVSGHADGSKLLDWDWTLGKCGCKFGGCSKGRDVPASLWALAITAVAAA